MPRFCPNCGTDLAQGITIEFWHANDRIYHAWCRACDWAGDIIRVTRMIGYEAAE